MHPCPERGCSQAMVRADFYDPEGTALLTGGTHDQESGLWWVCLRHSPSGETLVTTETSTSGHER